MNNDAVAVRRAGVPPLALAILFAAASLSIVALTLQGLESIWLRFAALGLFFVCIFAGLHERHFFNPYYLFSLTPLSLALYDYSFSTYYLSQLNESTYYLGLLCIATFLVGLMVANRQRAGHGSNEHRGARREESLFYPLLFLGMLPVIYGVAIAPNVLLSGDLLGMGKYVGMMPMSSILMICKYPALALAIKSKRKKRIAIALGCCIAALVLSFNKTNLIFLLFSTIFPIKKYLLTNARSNRVFIVVCALSAVVMVLSVTFYDSIRSDFNSTEALIARGASSSLPEPLMLPYMYLVSAWSNLQFVIETQPSHTFGLWLLRPLLFYFRIDGFFDGSYQLVAPSSYNTFTYIACLWKDFGFVGAPVVSCGLGLFVGHVYQKSRKSSSPFSLSAYALVAVAVCEMFFSNHFFSLVYPFTACIIAMLCDALAARPSKLEQAKLDETRQADRVRIDNEEDLAFND